MLRSTFIVGFPGETGDDFDQLLEFIQEAQLDRVGCFAYSPVAGAAANACLTRYQKPSNRIACSASWRSRPRSAATSWPCRSAAPWSC